MWSCLNLLETMNLMIHNKPVEFGHFSSQESRGRDDWKYRKFQWVGKLLEKCWLLPFYKRINDFKGVEFTVTLFTVPWCGSCKMMAKKLVAFSEENKEKNVQYTVIDADQILEGTLPLENLLNQFQWNHSTAFPSTPVLFSSKTTKRSINSQLRDLNISLTSLLSTFWNKKNCSKHRISLDLFSCITHRECEKNKSKWIKMRIINRETKFILRTRIFQLF